MATKRQPFYPAFIVLGLALVALSFSTSMAFLGAGAVFTIIGVAGMRRQRKSDTPDEE